MLVCFENDMVKDWPRIARTIRDMSKVHEARMLYWNFIEFVVSQRSPLFVLLLPFINQKVLICINHFKYANILSITKNILKMLAKKYTTIAKLFYTVEYFQNKAH